MNGSLIFAALTAVAVGAWLFGRDEEETGVSLIDGIGDWFAILTTSEETRVAQLEPTTQAKVRELIARLESEYGIKVHAGQTVRTPAQEKANVEAGKTSASLTHSWHEIARAIDMIPLLPDGSIDWNGSNLENFRTMHRLAEEIGFRSLAFNSDGTKRLIANSKGKKIWDGGHIEWRDPYDTLAQAIAAEGPSYGIA